MIKGFSITQVLGASGVTLSPSNVWNSAGTTFTGIQFNVTDTASAAGSMLLDLQVGGSSKFNVTKAGRVYINSTISWIESDTSQIYLVNQGRIVFTARSPQQVTISSDADYSWGNSTNASGGSVDLRLSRDAANTLAQRNGTNAQTKRIYGTYTDASNYRRVAIAMTTGGVASIAPEGAGTGASGNVLHISGLPTANPGPGILWNNGGTVEVGT